MGFFHSAENILMDNDDILEGMDEALHSMIAEGDLHTVFDPVHHELIFFLTDQDSKNGAERN